MVSRIPTWPDDECAKEFSEQSREINSCIRMAVRAQAIVMALTISRQCNEVIHVPNSEEFFRKVTMETAMEHSPEIFGLRDCDSRKMLRNWISDNISKQLMSLVPVSLFTEEDEDDDEAAPRENAVAVPVVPRALDGKVADVEHVEIPPSTPAVCDEKECTPPVAVGREPIPSSPPPQRREEPVGGIVLVEPPTTAIVEIPEEIPSTPPPPPPHVEDKTVALIPYEDKSERQTDAVVSSKIGLGEVKIESYDESEEFV
jgi:hypothetical protein